jgi:hypothetical protein
MELSPNNDLILILSTTEEENHLILTPGEDRADCFVAGTKAAAGCHP